jgi:predicted transcriptional regulator of viral defense system
LDLDRAIRYAQRLGVATAKRLGWVLETQGFELASLEVLRKVKTTGYIKLDPMGPRSGPYNARWKMQENLPGKIVR